MFDQKHKPTGNMRPDPQRFCGSYRHLTSECVTAIGCVKRQADAMNEAAASGEFTKDDLQTLASADGGAMQSAVKAAMEAADALAAELERMGGMLWASGAPERKRKGKKK